MRMWKPFYIHCGCGHRNRPAKSPTAGIQLALLGRLGNCKRCEEPLHPEAWEMDRPLVEKVRNELRTQGLLTDHASSPQQIDSKNESIPALVFTRVKIKAGMFCKLEDLNPRKRTGGLKEGGD